MLCLRSSSFRQHEFFRGTWCCGSFLRALGQAVSKRRLSLGLTQEQVGLESELGQAYVSGLERGRRNPTVIAIQAVAEALETSSSKLLGAAEQLGERN